SQDFGGLFLGFSFFLIVAALLLMAVLFQFALEQRRSEVGVLLALGFRAGRVRRLFVGEGGVIALGGAVLGGVLGLGFARAMIHGLSSIWREAVGGIPLGFHPQPATVAGGVAAAWLVATGTLWFALRRLARRPARELLQAAGSTGEEDEEVAAVGRRRGWLVLAVLCGLGAVGALASAWRAEQMAAAGGFFGGGAMLLIGGLALAQGWLKRLALAAKSQRPDWRSLALRGLTRRRRRSLATMALLAAGSFLIVSVGVFRLPDPRDTGRRDTGTGGFALVAESTQPVLYDLASAEGRDAYGLPDDLWQGGGVVAFRMREGEEASCLNLNRAQTPRVLGVNPEALASRGAFRFARMAKGLPRSLGWRALDREACLEAGFELGPDEVPAIGDAASIQYALGSRVGGVIPYRDERGREFKLRLVGAVANSILQGNLVIAEEEFVRRFPGEAGYRWFLIDAPADRRERVARELSRALADLGFEVTDARVRLAAFNAVQNTYLGTFQVLGALGLLLGSFGLGAVVLRNVLERRAELALMLAVGFPAERLQTLLLREHGWLLAGGLGIGVLSALLAVLPTVWKLGVPVPVGTLAVTLLAVAANGLLWAWAATRAAMRGNLIEALRND
ncbi:MAG: ABC transporter permease, partial [Verrucomicrobia bacterium]